MSRRPRIGGSSPWDTIQHIKEVEGSKGDLLWIDTAGHGGLWICPDLMPRFRKLFPDFEGYAGLPYLEEDCDWAMAVLAFPEFFDCRHVYHAVGTVSGSSDYMKSGKAYLDTEAGKLLVARAAKYEVESKAVT